MSRVRTLSITFLPLAIAGGLLFASAFGHAETGGDGAPGARPAASNAAAGSMLVAQADPRPAQRPRGWAIPPPPAPPDSPLPPLPPGRGHRRGVSVSIHDGQIEVDGVADLVESQLERIAGLLDDLPDVPPDVRKRVKDRIRAVRDRIHARIGKLKAVDLGRLGPEMERMGDEIEKEMEGLDEDLAQLGDKLGERFAHRFGERFAHRFGRDWARRFSVPPGHDSDDSDGDDEGADDPDDEDGLPPGADTDLADPWNTGPAIAAVRGLALDPDQRQQLAALREESDRQVASARRELEELSGRLHDTLRDAAASEADIARQIDAISAKEAAIRKAHILAWVKARNVLRPDQRERVEAAVRSR